VKAISSYDDAEHNEIECESHDHTKRTRNMRKNDLKRRLREMGCEHDEFLELEGQDTTYSSPMLGHTGTRAAPTNRSVPSTTLRRNTTQPTNDQRNTITTSTTTTNSDARHPGSAPLGNLANNDMTRHPGIAPLDNVDHNATINRQRATGM
jgi:hypothetical protein